MRKLSKEFMDDLKHGQLGNLLSQVKRDDTLSMEIRNGYVNVYYRGGSALRVAEKHNSYEIGFNINYTSLLSKNRPIIENLPKGDVGAWLAELPRIKVSVK